MTRIPLFLTLAAAAALAGCNKESHTIVAGSEPGDNEANVAAKAPIALPPSIVATKVYRCADNNVVTVDYLSDNKSADVHAGKGAPSVQIASAQPGKPMSAAGGYEVDGSATSDTAKITVPGHPSQSCKA